MQRKTVNLSEEAASIIEPFLRSGSPEQEELAREVGEEALPYSESGALASLALLGARSLRERLAASGYEQLAASYDEQDQEWTEAGWSLASKLWDREP